MSEDNNVQDTKIPASPTPPVKDESDQIIGKGYQPSHKRGYQSTVASTAIQPPQGGSVIAKPTQVGEAHPREPNPPLPPTAPPQGGSAAAASAPIPEQEQK